MGPNLKETADLATFTEETLNCAVYKYLGQSEEIK